MATSLLRPSFRTCLAGVVVATVVVMLAPAASAAPGELDPSFDGGGIVTTDFSSSPNDTANAIAIQSNGRIVAAGWSAAGFTSYFALARYTSAGALDATFGTGGKVTTPLDGSDRGNAVAIQPDGKIVVAGWTNNGFDLDFVLIRYTSAGALDGTFGAGGRVTSALQSGDDAANAVAIQPDGKILAAGFSETGVNDDFALVRYTSAGALDGTFGSGGKVITDVAGSGDAGRAVALQSDGKIVVAGYAGVGPNRDFAVVRYTSTGMLDPTFDTDGKATTNVGPSGNEVRGLAIQPDGKIVAAGYTFVGSNNDFALARYTSAGALDGTFGSAGKVITGIGSDSDTASAVALQSDGKIIAAGTSVVDGSQDFGLVRYTPAGALDTDFGLGGKATTPIGSSPAFAQGAAIQPDGKMVMAGFTNGDFALARFQTDPPALSISDATFTEVDAGTTDVTFTVSVALPGIRAPGPITVDFATFDGSAVAPGDYVPKGGSLTFAVGQTSKSIVVGIKGDLIDEPDETFTVRLSHAQGGAIANGIGVGTILNDDPVPQISIGLGSVTEGNSGLSNAVFDLTLTHPSSGYVTVDYVTADNVATAPADYRERSGTKVFSPGQTAKTITVQVKGETIQEVDETFFVKLLDPSGATLGSSQGLGTIVDDDRPAISIDNVSHTEGNSGTTQNYTFHVTLNHAGASTVTVVYATANGSAVSPSDYASKAPTTLTFTAGQLSKNVVITVRGDNAAEPTETFFVNLSSPSANASIADPQGVGTIVDNDPAS